MRVLTVRQPWAWAIIHGGKDVENRVRNVAGAYRGPVAIHAGLAYDHDSQLNSKTLRDAQDKAAVEAGAEIFPGAYLWDIGAPDPRKAWNVHGSIIGVVDIFGVHHASACHGRTVIEDVSSNLVRGYHSPVCSSWAEYGDTFHLVLANPRQVTEPIPFKGALGLRTLDDDTTARVLAVLSPSTGTQTESETEHG